jgi:hypothetical protein
MDFRSPVIRHAPVILAVLVHAGQRRYAQAFDRFARIKRGIHVHHQCLARPDMEPVGASDTGGIQQGINRQYFRIFCRLLDPERLEHRKFLGTVHAGIDCQPARRQAVLFLATHCAEITRAEKYRDITGQIDMGVHTKTGKTEINRKMFALQPAFSVIEHGCVISDFTGLATIHHMDMNRCLEKQAEMEKLDLETPALPGPQGMVVTVTDGLVLIPVQARNGLRDCFR